MLVFLIGNILNCRIIYVQIRILALVGGGDVGQATRRMMKKLMCDSVAREYNFRGKGTKRSFAALRLKTIVCGMLIRLYFCFLNLRCVSKTRYFILIMTSANIHHTCTFSQFFHC